MAKMLGQTLGTTPRRCPAGSRRHAGDRRPSSKTIGRVTVLDLTVWGLLAWLIALAVVIGIGVSVKLARLLEPPRRRARRFIAKAVASRSKDLQISGTLLAELPSEIRQLIQLETLKLDENRLEHLPPEIGRLENLKYLRLSVNALDELPPEFERLSALSSLALDHNRFVSLPLAVCRLTQLRTLDLTTNRLRSLRPEIGQLAGLEELDLSAISSPAFPPKSGS
jgi:Leucine-rich repeat (LRR) protein